MGEFRINKVSFRILNPVVSVWVSTNQLPDFRKKKITLFKNIALPKLLQIENDIYFSFRYAQNATEIKINLEQNKYFLKPYIDNILTEYFRETECTIGEDFIQGVQVWQCVAETKILKTYERISVRTVSIANLQKLELLISYDGKSLVSARPLSSFRFNSPFTRYLQDNMIYETRRNQINDENLVHPILNFAMRKELGLPFEGFSTKNTYAEYYKKISEFYDKFLKNKTIDNNVHFFSDGFQIIDEKQILTTNKVSNSLKFAENSDYNIFTGLKKYGPYKVPNTDNLRFIFIYKSHHRDAANKLYLAFKNGLTGNYNGLKDYVKVHFELATENKILLQSKSPVEELKQKLQTYNKQEGLQYFAIYLTDHRRFENIEENDHEYYQIKYLLLQNEILSQFVCYKNIDSPSFKYHLPNISVAILAKLGGVPWKLDTIGSNKLIVGFGLKRIGNESYIGNTLCFRDDGEFYEFETYQRSSIASIGMALRDSINKVIKQEELLPDKLIIHYYKTLSDDEAFQIESVLKEVNLEIPYIVLTINDTVSKDYLFFDVSSKDIMPVSGTIVEIKNKSEYLLANNERHSETQIYTVKKYSFPLKIKINKPSSTLYDVFDVKELIDQVYSFSRIYWKSISQVSLPVTIAYSKIVADLAAHFPEHTLPEKRIAHSNLWFL